MDTSLLNLEEHFSTCYVYEENNESISSDDINKSYFNEWENERELNGDIGLIPESSSFSESLKDIPDLTDSPPSLLFQKMIDWSSFIFVDGAEVLPHHLTDETTEDVLEKIPNDTFPTKENIGFDLATYIQEPLSPKPVIKSAGKKIDKERKTYIIDDKNDKSDTSDDVDIETIQDEDSLPVLEANDAFSLLEQFEASEKPVLPTKDKHTFGFSSNLVSNIEMVVNQIPNSPAEIFEDMECDTEIEDNNKKPSPKQNYVKSKQILEALPQELIARINESGKRKTITVIPPIPNKKRNSSRAGENSSQHKNKISKTVNNEQIQLDHDYCVASSPYPKEPHKDSGFQSSEEDDRSVIRNQPTVKTADGKLMVSLLKVNTIRNNTTNQNNQKKKLNLEEYKKRRLINSNTSQNTSPISSTCSSPIPEDENSKRLKHQEKLMKMAADLLNTPAKASKPVPSPCKKITPAVAKNVAKKIVPPPDLEVKTYVSTATNTDISSIDNNKSMLASAQQLEEIKPLLQKVSDKINSSSFITSLIENIPKVKTKSTSYVKSENQEVVREDKTIHYLKKDRLPVKTVDTSCQTDFDSVDFDSDTQSRYRRRTDERTSSSASSSRSSSHSARRRRRDSSNSSHRSRSSHSSDSSSSNSVRTSRSRSRSRSRSVSPRRARQYSAERLKEVEERRVIYVGRISKGTTKDDLRRRFLQFGPITNVSLHFRDYGDNYGFVTFANKEDAYEAVEHGNDGHVYPKYDLSFGGRRIFCKTSYSDLDNMREDDYSGYYAPRTSENSFDALLRAAQEKIRKRKS